MQITVHLRALLDHPVMCASVLMSKSQSGNLSLVQLANIVFLTPPSSPNVVTTAKKTKQNKTKITTTIIWYPES